MYSMASYCSVGERCISDVRKKLVAGGASTEAEQHIIERLLKDDFINEARFCRSFVNDKFKFNRWGRTRIRYELQRKNIPDELIAGALDLIDEDEYRSALSSLLEDKKRTLKSASGQDAFRKLYRFATGRGFEGGLILQRLKSLFNNDDVPDDMA